MKLNRNGDTRDVGLSLREIRGHLTVAGNVATAWYVIAPQRWAWLSGEARKTNILDAANALTVLLGHRIHIRVTDHPYPAYMWAENLDRATKEPLPGWREMRLKGDYKVIAGSGLSTKEVYLGVEIPLSGGIFGGLFSRTDPLERISERVSDLTHSLTTGRLHAAPATTEQIEWLMHRSIALGLPAPAPLLPNDDGVWEVDELHELADRVEVTHTRMADTVKLRLRGSEEPIERFVTVLTMSRPPRSLTNVQAHELPWMTLTETLDFPVEWSVRMGVVTGEHAAKKMSRQRLLITNLRRDYATHKLAEPGDLAAKGDLAHLIESEMNDAHPSVSSRVHGYIRLAVSGATEKEAVRRAQRVATLYNERLQWRVVPTPPGQWDLLRSFIPGEPFGQELYLRRMGIRNLAAGMPWAASDLGDNRGPYLGDTGVGISRPVMFDPHFGPEVQERSGLTAIIGEQGAGKSALIGRLAADSAERGIKTTVWDPSGPLAKLCTIGHLRPYSRHLDLSTAEPGTLNPYSMIGVPRPEEFLYLPDVVAIDDRDERKAKAFGLYEAEFKYAEAERKGVVRDVIMGLLGPNITGMPETEFVVGDAIRAVQPSPAATLWDVVHALDNHPETHGQRVANRLRDAAELPLARLYFPEPGARTDQGAIDEVTLLVITMPGLQLPASGVHPSTWDDRTRASITAMNLATLFAAKRTYGGHDRLAPKMLALDEVAQLGRWSTGVSFINRLARDTRKWNIAALVGSQNPEDLIGTSDENPGLGVVNLASAAFVGKMHDQGAARNALRLLGVPQDDGLAGRLLSLSPSAAADYYREFVLADQSGNVGTVRVELNHRPELLAALRSGVKGATDHRPAPAARHAAREGVLTS